jgi:hypothetical protein
MVDLIKIIENMPSGRTLWCDVFGEVTVKVETGPDGVDYISAKSVSTENFILLNRDGSVHQGCPCVLWPSRECRSWNNWQVALFKEGDFIDNNRTGKGKFIWASGTVYIGDFVEGADFDEPGFREVLPDINALAGERRTGDKYDSHV